MPRRMSYPLSYAALALLFGFLFLQALRLPTMAADASHDEGSRMSFEFFTKSHYQYGVDFVQNVGPYGFLQYPRTYSGILSGFKIAFNIIFAAVFALLALLACRSFSSWIGKGLWLVALGAIHIRSDGHFDQLADLFTFMSGHYLLTRARYRPAWLVETLVLAMLALLSLAKGVNFALIVALMAIVLADHLVNRRIRQAAWDTSRFAGAFLLLWILAGQNPLNIPAFLVVLFQYSSGYNEAMSMYAPNEWYLVALGIGVFALVALANGLRAWQFAKYRARIPLTIFECGCLFVVWKHSYVRIDHAGYFWTFVFAAAPLLFLAEEDFPPVQADAAAGPSAGRELRRRWASLPTIFFLECCATIAIAVCALTSRVVDFEIPVPVLAEQCRRMASNLGGLLHWSARREELEAKLAANRAEVDLPETRRIVGNSSIDQFGFLPGLILLNQFTYKPRPMNITFGATDIEASRRNAAFYQADSTAPDYLLAAVGTIDGRLYPQDDALTLLQVLRHYRPIHVEKGQLLLKRCAAGAEEPPQPCQEPRNYTWDERIDFPHLSAGWLWCTVDIRPSLFGTLRNFLYKPVPIMTVMETQGRPYAAFKFLSCAGRTGFLVNPLIVNNADLLHAYRIPLGPDAPRTPSPDSIRFHIDASAHAFYADEIRVSFSVVSEPRWPGEATLPAAQRAR
jgi:hypothetical protein